MSGAAAGRGRGGHRSVWFRPAGRGLERKIAGIATLLPRVTDVLVSADQEAEARHVAPDGLCVVGVGRAADAIAHVFGNALTRLLVEAGSDPERREELTASFFRLALVGSDAMVDWAPVARQPSRSSIGRI